MSGEIRAAQRDRDRFYGILHTLENRIGRHQLSECHGRMAWPSRGVYFFFEAGEFRNDGTSPRIVRVGTHAVSAGSRTTLWNRLSQHRGTVKTGGGNHRGSIFRLHVGTALLNRGEAALTPDTWGAGSSAPRHVRECEQAVERAVSAHIRAMPFLWVDADDELGKHSIRAVIERNAIGLLSNIGPNGSTADSASGKWLGRHADRVVVRDSGLWNVRETDSGYDPQFLALLQKCAKSTRPLGG